MLKDYQQEDVHPFFGTKLGTLCFHHLSTSFFSKMVLRASDQANQLPGPKRYFGHTSAVFDFPGFILKATQGRNQGKGLHTFGEGLLGLQGRWALRGDFNTFGRILRTGSVNPNSLGVYLNPFLSPFSTFKPFPRLNQNQRSTRENFRSPTSRVWFTTTGSHWTCRRIGATWVTRPQRKGV